jgi:hypothetical protein
VAFDVDNLLEDVDNKRDSIPNEPIPRNNFAPRLLAQFISLHHKYPLGYLVLKAESI